MSEPAVPQSASSGVAFRNATVMISLDCSGSTFGEGLRGEIDAVDNIAALLTSTAWGKSRVGPWNSQTELLIPIDHTYKLASKYGTEPEQILSDPSHVSAIDEADVWFLFTDGEILNTSTGRFAKEIPQKGLHGKPCVIIIFGRLPQSPIHANISVGVSLYSVVPNCIFLFHDIVSQQLFVLQSKGCFNVLNPKKTCEMVIDEHLRWSQLSTIEYQAFRQVVLPFRRHLEPAEILLQDGQVLNFDALLHDRLRADQVERVLSNQDNLDGVILTASTRGSGNQLQNWLDNQQLSYRLPFRPRTDDASAASLIVQILQTQRDEPDSRLLPALSLRLRHAHQQNWSSLVQSSDSMDYHQEIHTQTLDNAAAKVYSISQEGLSSASALTPTSPPPTRRSRPAQGIATRQTGPNSAIATPTSSVSAARSKTSYIIGYRKDSEQAERDPDQSATCSICMESTDSCCLLLKENLPPLGNESLPSLDNHADVSCSPAVASYPRTDVLSRVVCCDACAFHVVSMQSVINGERIIGAFPASCDLTIQMNLKTWLQTIDHILQHRFDTRHLPLIMLGIANRKLDELSSEATDIHSTFRSVLIRFRNHLAEFCGVTQTS